MKWETITQPTRVEDIHWNPDDVRPSGSELSAEEVECLGQISTLLLDLLQTGKLSRITDHTGGYFVVPRK